MPRKPRITAEPVEQPTAEEGLARAWNDEQQGEAKTDAEHMTEVINEVRVSDEEAPTLAEEPPAPAEKPKSKRAAKPKATAAEPAIEVKPALEEVQAVVELPKEDAKGDVKQACPDCGKQMSAKTLKYSHVCPSKKPAAQEQQPEQKAATKSQTVYSTDELIEWEIQRRMSNKRNERKAAREQMLRNLVQNAF